MDEVEPGSQAERLGLKQGDYVLTIENNRIWTGGKWPRTEQGTQTLTFQTAEGDARSGKIVPGTIGVNGMIEWHPEMAYHRSFRLPYEEE